MPGNSRVNAAESALGRYALAYPETREDAPWGHRAFKVRGKTFLFTNLEDDVLSLAVKLPQSLDGALAQPFASPTGHGLGKSGWVSARFEPRDEIPLDLLKAWLDESFRAIAPKRLVQALDAGRQEATKPAARRAVKSRAVKKRKAR